MRYRYKIRHILSIFVLFSILTIGPALTVNAASKTMTRTEMLNKYYPVGTYYETYDTSFNPNEAWGGTWVEDSAGRVLISAGTSDGVTYKVNSTGGEQVHALTPSETATKAHTHTYSKSNSSTNNTAISISQMPSHAGHLPVNSGSHTGYGNATKYYLADVTLRSYNTIGRGWNNTGTEITPVGINRGAGQGHNHKITLSNATTTDNPVDANGTAHNNMQPYKVVKRWHRTA